VKKRLVISVNNLPLQMPVYQTIVVYLLLDKLQASGLLTGIVYTFLALWWIVVIVAKVADRQVDIFKNRDWLP
jgi:hypothetical protein